MKLEDSELEPFEPEVRFMSPTQLLKLVDEGFKYFQKHYSV
jgi:hypothetical protein